MSPALIALLTQAGAPMLKRILTGKIGAGNAELVSHVIDRIAERAGVEPRMVEAMAETSPDELTGPIREVETMAPEFIELYTREIEARAALFETEQSDPVWVRAWRPAGMYLIGFLWLWQIVLLHVANATWKIALPPAPWDALFQVTGLYMALYMGGHTVKDFVHRKWGAAK